VKRGSGISRKLTVFCIRSVRSCCGATRTTLRAKHQRYMMAYFGIHTVIN
jgi:hypothetical protein